MKVFYNITKKKFSFKVYSAFAFLTFLISFSFTYYLINYQSRLLKYDLIKKGFLLSDVFAGSSKIGIFSGNQDLIHDSVELVLQQEEIKGALIFDKEGKLLKMFGNPVGSLHKKSASWSALDNDHLLEKLKQLKSPTYIEERDMLEFWTPVFANTNYYKDEEMLFEKHPRNNEAIIIGFAGLTISKYKLKKQIKDLFFKGILIGSIFMIVGFMPAYFLAKKIINPLHRLSCGVKTLELGKDFNELPVKSEDEVGMLAKTFNSMALSLINREKALKESKIKLQFLSGQILNTQEKERRRISRELHDELGQNLAFLKVRVNSIERKTGEAYPLIGKECRETCQHIDQILENIRRFSKDLSPYMLEDLGLTTSLRVQSRDFSEYYNLILNCNIEDIDNLFTEEAQINIYRFFQEAMTNISKHSQAKTLNVKVKKTGDNIKFIVEDDGKGFDVACVMNMSSTTKGIGLTTLEERAYMLGGRLDVISKPGKGTSVILTAPVEKVVEVA